MGLKNFQKEENSHILHDGAHNRDLTSSPPPSINDVHGHNSGGMVEDLKNGVVRVTLPSDHPMNGTGGRGRKAVYFYEWSRLRASGNRE